jgi:hypothetical protein
MHWLSMTPQVVRDDADGLVVEESHLGRAALWAAVLLLSGAFLIPAAESGSLSGLVIGVTLAAVVVGLPFLVVLRGSRFRRLEVRRGREVVSVVVYRVRPPRAVRVPWAEIDRVVCERVEGGSADAPAGLRLTAHLTDGTERVLLGGWYADGLAAVLGRHLEGKFVPAA